MSRGLVEPTEIQVLALPLLMPVSARDSDEAQPGKSAVLQAETGTGKTICYLLPMLEHLRLQLSTMTPGGRVTPAGLVVVPTRELAAQVYTTACSLLPEAARYIRVVSGSVALGASQEVGIIISTPVALEANVHFRQLLWVRSVVLDEADMLLSGAFMPAVKGYLLARFKQRMPEDRPQHIFCGATVPCSGTKSVASFLAQYYPPPGVLRISTPGCHRALPLVVQVFIQIDAAVPLTRLELASQQLLRSRAITELRAKEVLHEAATTTNALEETEESEGAEVDVLNATSESVTDASTRHDGIAEEMKRRELEDESAELRADHADYVTRVIQLRLHVLLEALLLPSQSTAGVAEQFLGGGASQPLTAPGSDVQAGASQQPFTANLTKGSRAARRHSRVDVLGLSNGMPVSRGRASEVEPAPRYASSTTPVVPETSLLPAPSLSFSLRQGETIIPLATPPALRTGLTPEECARVPATLVFVNSASSALSLRKALKAAAPELSVEAVHAKVDDDERAMLLQRFAKGALQVLVCTDVLARGIDTIDATHVIQAEFANDAVSHLHRVGRTGRAGALCASPHPMAHFKSHSHTSSHCISYYFRSPGSSDKPLDAC